MTRGNNNTLTLTVRVLTGHPTRWRHQFCARWLKCQGHGTAENLIAAILRKSLRYVQSNRCACFSLKLECEKLASEKIEIQRHYVMVSDRGSTPLAIHSSQADSLNRALTFLIICDLGVPWSNFTSVVHDAATDVVFTRQTWRNKAESAVWFGASPVSVCTQPLLFGLFCVNETDRTDKTEVIRKVCPCGGSFYNRPVRAERSCMCNHALCMFV